MNAKRIMKTAGVAVSAALAGLVMVGSPAYAADSWQSSGYHVGDVCTTGNTLPDCNGSASFVKYGDHLYIWDNAADGHSVVVIYYRSDRSGQLNVWNKHGAGTRVDHNMDIPENGWINYSVCLGDGGIEWGYNWTCSPWKVENAS